MALTPPPAGKTPFELCPSGLQQLVCVDVVDHGMVATNWGGQERIQPKISIRWQSKYRMRSGKPYLIQKRYTFSMHPKATLRKDIDTWRGQKLTDDEAARFDLERLLGVNCFANVLHVRKPKGIFAEVVSLMPIPRDTVKLECESYTRVSARKPGETHEDGPERAPAPGEAQEPEGGGDDSFELPLPEEPAF